MPEDPSRTRPHPVAYLFNLRVLLRAMFSLVATRFISATVISRIFNVRNIAGNPVKLGVA